MNIFKHKYSVIKLRLRDFGGNLKNVQYDAAYWERIMDSFRESDDLWGRLLSEYIFRCCDELERKFIDLYFFKKNKLIFVSQVINLCERSCQEWREEILKNLILLVVHNGLMRIEIGGFLKDAVLIAKNKV